MRFIFKLSASFVMIDDAPDSQKILNTNDITLIIEFRNLHQINVINELMTTIAIENVTNHPPRNPIPLEGCGNGMR